MIKYFHELTKEEFSELIESGKYTWGSVGNDYHQPAWCEYPGATEGQMGCWSLTMITGNVSDEFCKTCDCYRAAARADAHINEAIRKGVEDE